MSASLKVRSEGVGNVISRVVRFDFNDFPDANAVPVLEIPGDAIPLASFLSFDVVMLAGSTISVGDGTTADLYLAATAADALAVTALDADWLNVGKPFGTKKTIHLKSSAAQTVGSGWLVVTYIRANSSYTTQG